jgi:hypothetical protein
MTSQDYPTFNFLQWYVAEQHEEEKLFKSVIDKLTLAGKSGEGLYFIDKELAARHAELISRRDFSVAAFLMRQILFSAVLNLPLAINLPFSLKTPPAPPRSDFPPSRYENAPLRQSGGEWPPPARQPSRTPRGEHHLQHFMTMNRRHNPSCKTPA